MEFPRFHESVGDNMHPVVRAILQSAVTYVMRIATSTTSTNYMRYIKNSIITAANTTVVDVNLKVETSGSDFGHSIGIANGAKEITLALKSGSIICNYGGTSPFTHTMDTTSAYHTYRLKFIGTTGCEFYVDDTLIHTATYANIPASTNNRISFGDGSGAANRGGSILYKAVAYNTNFVSSPDNFIYWDSSALPSTQGWTADGTESLASIITE
jgi:hypothetical protein